MLVLLEQPRDSCFDFNFVFSLLPPSETEAKSVKVKVETQTHEEEILERQAHFKRKISI